MLRSELTDEEFALIQPLLPPERSGKPGRPFHSHHKILSAILWTQRAGAPWRDLPSEYGKWSTAFERFRRWRREGFFQKVLDALESQARKSERIDFEFSAVDGSTVRAHKCAAGAQKGASPQESLEKQALGRSRGGFSTKIHVLCEGKGLPIYVTVTPGQSHESQALESLLDAVRIGGKPGAPRTRFDVVSGDKGYDGQEQRQAVRDRGSEPLIAHRKDRQGQYPPEAEDFDKELYKRRNVVERLIGRLKEYRRIATRYEKLAESFRCFAIIGFIRIWTRNLLLDRA